MAYYVSLTYYARTTPNFEFDSWHEGKPLFGLSRGRPVAPERIPSSAHQLGTKRLHDVFPMPGVNAVNRRFRDLIERFEPGVHQFFPLALRRKDGTPIDEEYFVFNACQHVDTILTTRSEGEWTTGDPPHWATVNDGDSRWVLSRPAIAGRHVWCGDRIWPNATFFSDELFEAFKAAKLRHLTAFYCPEIDEPWVAAEQLAPRLAWETVHGRYG